jgi:hypothetical protein
MIIFYSCVCVCVCDERWNNSSLRRYRLRDMAKLIVAFRHIANAHKNDISYRLVGYDKLTIQYKGHNIAHVNFMSLVTCSCFYN